MGGGAGLAGFDSTASMATPIGQWIESKARRRRRPGQAIRLGDKL